MYENEEALASYGEFEVRSVSLGVPKCVPTIDNRLMSSPASWSSWTAISAWSCES